MSDSTDVGQVVGLEIVQAGGNAVGDHPAGATLLQLDDTSDFPELEGTAQVGTRVVDVLAADDETNTLTLAAPTTELLEDGDRVAVLPSSPTTWAQVIVDADEPALLVEVPFGLKALNGLGVGDLVRFTEDGDSGALRLLEVIAGDPSVDASHIDNAEELLLESQKTLGQKLEEAANPGIDKLTAPGDASLSELVAQRIWAGIAVFAQITADKVLAGDIQAVWTITAGGKLIAGDPAGAAVELDHESITIWDVDADGVRHVSSMLGGPGADSLTLTDSAGQITAGFKADGTMTAQAADIVADALIGGRSLLGSWADPPAEEAGWLDLLPLGVVARQNFTATSATRAAGEEWGYAALKATLRAGRLYRVAASVEARAQVVGGVVVCRLRSADGSANQNSQLEGRVDLPPAATVSSTPQGYLEGYVSRATDTEVEILLTYQGAGGATPAMYSAEMVIEDVGPSGSYGGGSYKQIAPPATESEAPPPSTTTREYTSVWRASDSATFWADGSRRSTSDAAGDLVQGSAGSSSSQRGVALFTGTAVTGETSKTIGQALSGASVKKVEIFLYANHTYQSVGGRFLLGPLGSASVPSTLTSGVQGTVVKPSGSYIKRGSGQWFTVGNNFFDSGNRGLVVGNRSTTNPTYYVRANGHAKGASYQRPAVRITYTR